MHNELIYFSQKYIASSSNIKKNLVMNGIRWRIYIYQKQCCIICGLTDESPNDSSFKDWNVSFILYYKIPCWFLIFILLKLTIDILEVRFFCNVQLKVLNFGSIF